MRYIRTKDGRIIPFLVEDKETKLPNRDLRFYYIQPNNVIAFIGKNEIISQADTIKELCDEFVIKYKDGTHDTLNYDFSQRLKYMEMEQYNMELTFGNCDLFGAIWTDKGLIYKAKMKGILPNGEIDWELI